LGDDIEAIGGDGGDGGDGKIWVYTF